jgi:hypothetical protein
VLNLSLPHGTHPERQGGASTHIEGSAAQRETWQKDYFSGRATATSEAPTDHRTKVKPFK